MSAFRASALLLACAIASGCASLRAPDAAEVEPLVEARAAPGSLPDLWEQHAARAAAHLLAGRYEQADDDRTALVAEDIRRRDARQAPTALVESLDELTRARAGSREWIEGAQERLELGELRPLEARRLERALASQPLVVARRALADERRFKLAAVVNRVTQPLFRLVFGVALDPVAAGRSAISTLLTVHHFPEASPRERRALVAYERYLRREPEGEHADEARHEARRLREKLSQQRQRHALDRARELLDAGKAGAALWESERALREAGRDERPGAGGVDVDVAAAPAADPLAREALELRSSARAELAEQGARLERALGATALGAEPLREARYRELAALAAGALTAAPAKLAGLAAARPEGPGGHRDAMLLAAVLASDRPGRDTVLRRELQVLAERAEPAIARHAEVRLDDPRRNPWPHWQQARADDRSARWRWILLGRHADGAVDRGLWRPLEWLLDVPGFATSLVLTPLRLVRYPQARAFFGRSVLVTGERYVRRFPQGAHATEVREELRERYARLGLYSRALDHYAALPDPDPATTRRYREALGEALLAAADREPRLDMKLAIVRNVLVELPDTPQAAEARRKRAAWLEAAQPQHIRLSRDFLLEHPRIAGPEGLGLRPELLDDRRRNGELAEDGVALIGGRWIEIALRGREPLSRRLGGDRMARVAALLEEARYRDAALATDVDVAADPQRDQFLDRARLGLLDEPDMRPGARSDAEYLSRTERYGFLQRREPILPIDLILRGDLGQLGLAAFPRIRPPAPEPDAFLYE